ncbi:hypothetical protein GCM10010287_36840 [Streptomyces variabilis]|uniref:Uncharacterized protein n=1 Tax=Streptomyces variabilis TaxID=67372 RepID=A0ABQ2U3W9_9ACTN|nr:hypothetical protein GCM10010265_66610 [Streptomyces griseoincarnatus]GGT59255.1 hypothetical protein GCM10010287_36840 [Streptomyces variabilis]
MAWDFMAKVLSSPIHSKVAFPGAAVDVGTGAQGTGVRGGVTPGSGTRDRPEVGAGEDDERVAADECEGLPFQSRGRRCGANAGGLMSGK